MNEDLGWTATYALLAVGWLVVFGLHVARGTKEEKDKGSISEAVTVDVPPEIWTARLIALIFFVATLGVIFADPELHAWALTRYTVWTFVCSLAYLAESQRLDSKIRIRPVVLCFCVCAELVVGVGYWSLYGSETYISEQSTLNQFHSTAAHMVIQIVLLLELYSLAATKNITELPFASTLLYLSTYMVTYATAVFSYCAATDSTLPYAIIDPREEGGFVPLWLLLAWFAHAVFCWIVTAGVGRRNSLADCSTLLSGEASVKGTSALGRISVPADFLFF